jgi:hypothetical protein
MEPRGCNPWQSAANRPAFETQKQAKSVATDCHRSPATFHGKQGVCRGLPPVAGGPLPEREEVDLFRNAKSCEPEGPQDLTQRL